MAATYAQRRALGEYGERLAVRALESARAHRFSTATGGAPRARSTSWRARRAWSWCARSRHAVATATGRRSRRSPRRRPNGCIALARRGRRLTAARSCGCASTSSASSCLVGSVASDISSGWCVMATARVHSVALEGIAGSLVTIEADVHNGVPGWALTGLARQRRRCNRATGAGRRSSTAARSGPIAGSPWRSTRPTSARSDRTTTSPSRFR